ncbi:MAG: SDR family oxidoreductase [Sandaracinaceae bacterium]
MSVFRQDILAGKVAFVTGGGSGICKGIAHAYLAHGASVAIVGRKEDRLRAAADELSEATGGRCVATAADVREPAKVEAALDAAGDALGPIDIVVNGAAGNFLCPAATMSYNAFATVMAIDALGTWNVTRAAFERSLKDRGGQVLNISATLHYAATPLQAHASAAKAAIDSLTKSLALEWGSLGIRVNAIAPGPIEGTEGMARLANPDLKTKLTRSIPLQRFGTIEDIANAALFLSSEAASYVSGEILVVDGGSWLPGMGAGFSMG